MIGIGLNIRPCWRFRLQSITMRIISIFTLDVFKKKLLIEACGCVVIITHECKCPKRSVVSGSLGLELEAVRTCLDWMQGTAFQLSVRTVHALNCWSSPVPSSIQDIIQKGETCLPSATIHLFNCSALIYVCHSCLRTFNINMGWGLWEKCLGMPALPFWVFHFVVGAGSHYVS